MPMSKYYVVLYDSKNIYFPVKARYSPYNNQLAFCGGYPQFFGGRPDSDEGVVDALVRETSEESINTYTLTDGSLPLIYEGNVGSGDRPVHGGFFCSPGFAKSTTYQWPASREDWQHYPRKCREMCCVASAPISDCMAALNMPPGLRYPGGAALLPNRPQLANALQQSAIATAPDWAQQQMPDVDFTVPPDELSEDAVEFLNSESLIAFAAFMIEWNVKSLPAPPS